MTHESPNLFYPRVLAEIGSASPAPPEIMPHIVKMVQSFKSVYPNWNGVPLETPESVSLMLDILNKVTPEDNGKFISHKASQI